MKRDLITKPVAPIWELVEEVLPTRMFTSAELERLQCFGPLEYTRESPPCAHFANPQKPRLT